MTDLEFAKQRLTLPIDDPLQAVDALRDFVRARKPRNANAARGF